MNRILLTISILIVSALHSSFGAATIVNWKNTLGTELFNLDGTTKLTAGTSSLGDGAILQLGYYSLATDQNPFNGAWIPLTGEGSANSFVTTVGDFGSQPDGRFDLKHTFTLGSSTTGNNLPAIGTPLAIRFYNATSIANSQFFNAVSDTQGSWDWLAPNVPASTVDISLGDAGLVWQGGASSAFRTTQTVPEPATSLLFIVALVSLLVIRQRRSGILPVA
jgi:hypothetical protein